MRRARFSKAQDLMKAFMSQFDLLSCPPSYFRGLSDTNQLRFQSASTCFATTLHSTWPRLRQAFTWVEDKGEMGRDKSVQRV